MDSKIKILVVLLIGWSSLSSQDNYGLAKKAFQNNQYQKALTFLNQVDNIEENLKAISLRGKIYYRTNDLDRTIRDLTRARKLGYDDPDVFMIMAKTMQHKGVYEEAIYFYKNLLTKIDHESDEATHARIEIKNCLFSIQNNNKRNTLLVQGFGEGINSIFDELYVVQSPQYGNLFYYSTVVNDRLAMQASFLNEQGNWLKEDKFDKSFSSNYDQWTSDVSSDGRSLMFFQENKGKTQPRISTLINNQPQIDALDEKVFKNAVDIQILNHNTCLFASNRPGGFGGYDIYLVKYEENKWNDPVNLGPEINSAFDERSPYMSADKKLMYFSSNKPYCYGGYDVYRADFQPGSTTVEHINSTINSAGDDLGFRLHHDAQMAFFFSNRKSGNGGFDLYFAYLDEAVAFEWADSLNLSYVHLMEEVTEIDNSRERKDSIIITTTPEEDSTIDLVPLEDTLIIDSVYITEANTRTEVKVLNDNNDIRPVFAHSLFYQDKTDLLRDKNAQKLSSLIDFLKAREDLKIKLLVYADHMERGLPEYIQYNNIKRGLAVADYLGLNGIHADRIAIESYANNYPLAKYEVAGKVQKELSRYNRRIDIEIFDWQGNVYLAPDTGSFPVPQYARAREYNLFADIREEVYFSVKIASVDRMFKNAVLRIYQDVYVRKESMDHFNDYYIGIYTDYASAKALAEKLNNQPRIDATVVPFYNGNKINKVDINRLETHYPELSHLKE